MKDNGLKTSFENYEAFDIIAGSSFGTWTDRETALGMVQFLNGSINEHPDYQRWLFELAETPDDQLSGFLSDLEQGISDAVGFDDEYHYFAFRDNEFTVLPAIEGAIEDHRESDRITDDLPEPDSTHHCGDTWMTVNDHGNTSLYRFVDTVTGWKEIWSVV